jgi:D-3-phosphoglycerate dehydrogenase
MRVLIADKFEKHGIEGLRALGCDVVSQPTSAEELPAVLAGTNPRVLVVRSTKVSAPAIQGAPSLAFIIRAGSGVDNIDVGAASTRGVAVSNCPGMNAVAVAELAMGLLIGCDRRIPDQTADLRAGVWNKKEYGKARGLRGTTLGVVGAGSIGLEVIRLATAFGMHVHAWARSVTPERAAVPGVKWWGPGRDQLHAMAGACDAVSVHVALTDETRGMCGREFFAALKPGSYFINTSRGGVVDAGALADAVRTKGVRCGLDVWSAQPAPTDAAFRDELIKLPGVYGTHHCGASTDQAQLAVADEVVRLVHVYKETGRFENQVNAGASQQTLRQTSPSAERVRS